MQVLPFELVAVIVAFSPLFSERVFAHAQLLLLGAILTPGRRTVTSVLRVMGRGDDPQFQNFHRVLNRARWSALEAARILLRMLVETFAGAGPLVFGIDETIERRRGAKIAAKGIYRDPVRSSRSHFVKASGLRWISVMLLVPVPWAARVWALPFLTVLAPSERYYAERGRQKLSLVDRAIQALRLVCRWLPGRELVAVGDSTYAALELLAAVRGKMCVVTRLRLDAALYEPAPPRRPGQNGRPRKKGSRLPTLDAVLTDAQTRWRTLRVEDWYGKGPRRIQIASQTCVWYHSGKPAVPIRWVLIRDPQGAFEPQALLATKLDATPEQILGWFMRRWQMEATFEEARAQLGVETQRQWSDRAIARATPVILGLYSIVTLMAERVLAGGQMPVRQAAWYAKEHATFSDTIALVRRCVWSLTHFSMSESEADVVKIPRPLLQRFIDTLCYAA